MLRSSERMMLSGIQGIRLERARRAAAAFDKRMAELAAALPEDVGDHAIDPAAAWRVRGVGRRDGRLPGD